MSQLGETSTLGGEAVEILNRKQNNHLATLNWTEEFGFTTGQLSANKLRDQWGTIHAREVHSSLYSKQRFQPSELGRQYFAPIFKNAIGHEDMEAIKSHLFSPDNLLTRYQSFNVEMQKRIQYLD